jgi:hypothetical protein
MASTYLTKTFSGNGTNANKWTFSAWLKRSSLAPARIITAGTSTRDGLIFNGGEKLQFFVGSNSTEVNAFITNRRFRDTSAWYHIVVSADSTQSGSSNQVKLYVNGELETSYEESASVDSNLTWHLGNGIRHRIGTDSDSSLDNYFDGSMSHIHFCDGYVYDADDFGSIDSTTGIWKPKTNPSVTYGTNGFFLNFEDTSNFGDDTSGNGNDFTTTGTMTQTIDTPSNVFATLNPLYNSGGTATYANGNTNLAESDNQWKTTFSTLGASSGKYYAEFKSNGNWTMIGVADYNVTKSGIADRNFASTTFISEQGYGYYNGNGDLYYRGSSTTYGATYGNGDIVQVALDCDNNRVFFGKNGTWQNSADPTTPSTGFAMTATNATYVFAVAVQNNNLDCNFGNGYFGTTAVSSAGTNAGVGTFEYDVPSGFKALCTKNINAEEYS